MTFSLSASAMPSFSSRKMLRRVSKSLFSMHADADSPEPGFVKESSKANSVRISRACSCSCWAASLSDLKIPVRLLTASVLLARSQGRSYMELPWGTCTMVKNIFPLAFLIAMESAPGSNLSWLRHCQVLPQPCGAISWTGEQPAENCE